MDDTLSSLVATDRAIQITENGANIIGEISLEQWQHGLSGLRKVKQVYHRALADMVKYGNQRYGAAVVQESMSQLEFDLADASRATAICALGEGVRSQPRLTSEHQYVIGLLLPGNEAGQEKWAKLATEENLSASDLRLSIGQDRVTRARDRVTGFSSFESMIATFRRCRKHFQDVVLTVQDRRHLLKVLQPIVDYCQELSSGLPA